MIGSRVLLLIYRGQSVADSTLIQVIVLLPTLSFLRHILENLVLYPFIGLSIVKGGLAKSEISPSLLSRVVSY